MAYCLTLNLIEIISGFCTSLLHLFERTIDMAARLYLRFCLYHRNHRLRYHYEHFYLIIHIDNRKCYT